MSFFPADFEPPSVRVPGGWELRRFGLSERGERELAFWIPADPDAFLGDEEAVSAHGPSRERPERSDIPFWQYVWPAAETMARLVFANDWSAEGLTVGGNGRALELGAGVGLVGLAALAAGWHVTFSDYQEPALAVAACNARQNGFTESEFETECLDWNAPSSTQFPVIFGCEVIYERAIHEPILNVLDHMLAPGGVAWLGDPGRSPLPRFLAAAASRGYAVEIRDARGQRRPASTFGEFQLVILWRERLRVPRRFLRPANRQSFPPYRANPVR